MAHHALAEKVMPFGDHLEDLRSRIIYALVGILPILAISLYFGRSILAFLVRPVVDAFGAEGESAIMQVTSPFELFSAYVKVSFVLTVLVGAPWILIQLWRFIAPGLHAHERRFAYILAPLSALLTLAGGAFLYFIMLPVILAFFVLFNASLTGSSPASSPLPAHVSVPSVPILDADPHAPAPGAVWYNRSLHQLRICVPTADGAAVKGAMLSGGELISQQYRVSEYIGIVLGMALALAVAFQMPVVVLLLGWAGIIEPAWMSRYRRHAVMVCAVLGAVLTPADPLSMFLLAVPLYALYELGLLLLRLLPARRVVAGFGRPGRETRDGDSTSTDDPAARADDR